MRKSHIVAGAGALLFLLPAACGSSDSKDSNSSQGGPGSKTPGEPGEGDPQNGGTGGDGDGDLSGGSNSPGAGGTPTSLPGGVHHTLIESLPGAEPTACESQWIVRVLRPHPTPVVPRRMYFDSCNTDTNTPSMYVSLSVGENAALENGEGTSGAIVKTTLDPATGKLMPDEVSRQFPECVWMHGIAVSEDCGTVAALCRRHYGDDDYTMDSLATHNAQGWMTQPDCAAHEMWLYEWENGDITTEPQKYVVHRGVSTNWDHANNSLVMGDDNTYGIAIKARNGDATLCHEADAFLVMDRTDHSFTNRGWSWACGAGHTRFNKLSYNPASGKYGMMCGTDFNTAMLPRMGALWFRLEDQNRNERNEFMNIWLKALNTKGGVGFPQPLADGGFLGLIVGVDGEVVPLTTEEEVPLEPPTAIGMARFNASGETVGEIKWIVQDSDHYLSYPQLTPLGDDRYLMGWGVMYDVSAQDSMSDNHFRVPMEYWVQEIDIDGKAVTEPLRVEGAGWGEQDRMVPLGAGTVAWAYIPDPAITAEGTIPSCNSEGLQLSVYRSSAP